MLVSLATGWLQMLLLTIFFPLLPLGLAVCQLLSISSRPKRAEEGAEDGAEEGLASAAGRLSLLRLLRRGAMLALLIAVWPLLLAGLVLRWWTLTPSVARASFLQEGLTSRLGLG